VISLVSKFALKFTLYRYTSVSAAGEAAGRAVRAEAEVHGGQGAGRQAQGVAQVPPNLKGENKKYDWLL
jgi:hypothetical protein